MAKITYIEHTNKKYIIEVPNNMSVMEGAVQNNIPGIDADCGGSMACATCHVYVDEKWFNKLKKKDEGEEDMLDMAYQPKKFSRLSCQLIVSNEFDGLILRMPSKQG
jgi:2Fe-2S ferredoxin